MRLRLAIIGLTVGFILACGGGSEAPGGGDAVTDPAPKPGKGKKGKKGKRGGGGEPAPQTLCCEMPTGPGGAEMAYWVLNDEATCKTDRGTWVDKPECAPTCCEVAGGGMETPEFREMATGSCKYYCCGMSQTPADASKCE